MFSPGFIPRPEADLHGMQEVRGSSPLSSTFGRRRFRQSGRLRRRQLGVLKPHSVLAIYRICCGFLHRLGAAKARQVVALCARSHI
jgi:hypothetical protein